MKFSLFSASRKAICQGVANHETDEAAENGGDNVAAGGQIVPGAEEHGVLKSEGGQGGVATTEAGGEGETQVGGFDEPCSGQPAEEPHEQAAAEVDDEGVPRHICRGDSPASADEIAGEVAQHTTEETAAADTKQSLE